MIAAFIETMKMIKIEHSIFALPFAIVSATLAAAGWPPLPVLGLIVLAMVSARSAAMAFNRYLDAEIDARNPRTRTRSIPAGRLTKSYAFGFTLATCALFVFCAWLLNPLAFYLSPLVLAILLGYSFTKRFTSWCHFILGLALGLAPLGAWIAVTGTVHWMPCLLGLAVLAWTAGFDIIYACQDLAFDRQQTLHSVPARTGVANALMLSRLLHLGMAALLIAIGLTIDTGWLYWIGFALVVGCLCYEHSLVWGGRLEKVNMAFFTMNGAVSLIFGITTVGSILLANT